MTECPHCHTKIFVRPDGSCPSCGKSALSKIGADDRFTILEIKEAQKLPNICFNCGHKSEKEIKLHEKIAVGGESGIVKVVMFIMSPIRFLMNNGYQSDKRSVYIKLPICLDCKSRLKKIKPKHTDFLNSTMTFIVHKNFKKEFEDLQKK